MSRRLGRRPPGLGQGRPPAAPAHQRRVPGRERVLSRGLRRKTRTGRRDADVAEYRLRESYGRKWRKKLNLGDPADPARLRETGAPFPVSSRKRQDITLHSFMTAWRRKVSFTGKCRQCVSSFAATFNIFFINYYYFVLRSLNGPQRSFPVTRQS